MIVKSVNKPSWKNDLMKATDTVGPRASNNFFTVDYQKNTMNDANKLNLDLNFDRYDGNDDDENLCVDDSL